MTSPEDSPKVIALLDELAEVSTELHRTNREQEARYEVRLDLYRRLAAEGVTQARMAKIAGVTNLAVSAALRKAAKQDAEAASS